MRILYHHRTASKDGQAVHIEEMISALRELGHEVLVVAPELGSSEKNANGLMGEEIGWVSKLKASLPRSLYEILELGYSVLAYRRLCRAVVDFKPDVVYERYNLYFIAGALLHNTHRIPLLLEVNSPLVFERSKHSGGLGLKWLARWSEKFSWRTADVVLPVTNVLANYVREYGVPESKISVIPNGINQSHFASAPSTEKAKERLGLKGKIVLGFTGFVREWHKVDRVISWMATPQAPEDVHLLIVGDGPVRNALEKQAKLLGIASSVSFSGIIHRESVPEYVAAFDIALQPAVTDYASPLKMMEYLALGKAIVAPRMPNIQEILSHRENSLLFDESVVGSLESALTELSHNAEFRNKLGKSARETIEHKQLTWIGNALRVTKLAQDVCLNRVNP